MSAGVAEKDFQNWIVKLKENQGAFQELKQLLVEQAGNQVLDKNGNLDVSNADLMPVILDAIIHNTSTIDGILEKAGMSMQDPTITNALVEHLKSQGNLTAEEIEGKVKDLTGATVDLPEEQQGISSSSLLGDPSSDNALDTMFGLNNKDGQEQESSVLGDALLAGAGLIGKAADAALEALNTNQQGNLPSPDPKAGIPPNDLSAQQLDSSKSRSNDSSSMGL